MTYRVHEKTLNMEINSPAKAAEATLRKRSSRSDLAQKEKRIGAKNRGGDNNKGEKRYEVARKREKQAKYKRKRRER